MTVAAHENKRMMSRTIVLGNIKMSSIDDPMVSATLRDLTVETSRKYASRSEVSNDGLRMPVRGGLIRLGFRAQARNLNSQGLFSLLCVAFINRHVTIDAEIRKCLLLSARPINLHRLDRSSISQTRNHPRIVG